jgi:biopolymer transport protein TolQ
LGDLHVDIETAAAQTTTTGAAQIIDTLPVSEAPSILSMVWGSGFVVQAVLLILIALSVWSWAITIAKILQIRIATRKSAEFSDVFWESRNFSRVDETSRRLEGSPLASVFSSGYRELMHIVQENTEAQKRGIQATASEDLGTVERALRRAELDETHRLEKGVTFLATVASAAPFIGLFGTVWGIMNAFHGLGQAKSTTIQAVAPGISEALVATAVGLAAAIPAAIAFNYFTSAIRQLRQKMDSFSSEFLNIAKRYFVR